MSFILPIFEWNVPLVSLIFLKRSPVFPILLFSSISLHCSLRKALSLLAILWNSVFRWVYLFFYSLPFTSLLLLAICKTYSDNHFAFLHFFSWGWSWSLPPLQCHEPPSIVLQVLCLSDLIPWIYLSLLLYNCKGFVLGAVTPQETDPDLPVSVQESLMEAWVSSGLLQGLGYWVRLCVHGTLSRRLPLSSLPPP